MYIHFMDIFKAVPKQGLGPGICTADQETLAIFNNMSVIIVCRIAPAADINSYGAIATGSTDHLTECAVFIAFPARLDDKVCKTPGQNGKVSCSG